MVAAIVAGPPGMLSTILTGMRGRVRTVAVASTWTGASNAWTSEGAKAATRAAQAYTIRGRSSLDRAPFILRNDACVPNMTPSIAATPLPATGRCKSILNGFQGVSCYQTLYTFLLRD